MLQHYSQNRRASMQSDIIIQLHKNFEDYAPQIDGEEFWFARIRSKGDAALFGGKTTQQMKDRLGMPDKLGDIQPDINLWAEELDSWSHELSKRMIVHSVAISEFLL